jgi:hypothetical protein
MSVVSSWRNATLDPPPPPPYMRAHALEQAPPTAVHVMTATAVPNSEPVVDVATTTGSRKRRAPDRRVVGFGSKTGLLRRYLKTKKQGKG